ncbi:conserved hypothetical protein [Yersinia pestis biovar Antiqua str. B42003004]|uniref:Uncharacterized protein n=1 Tax=Yersinia pestis biovar Orientalis str. IP275 TaxID=373665 RepID=A0AAV3BK26_YERPE|nr:conserved hypothetical protein [Yersinia pestis biovar Orientalis str. IP275]EDR44380.1 conserved hypothetical protein [Yersinia pestis biovar Antiqua str. E1979001]EDR51396.1 conserved hypothetical protein [Yersinia pestis biovar Antiqua str. B42003004]EDR61265.1 conserved hypothetical protein [Yersinia pestis biovar Antiqua str. UG05-0454]EIR38145.1 putative membrane protein [Yersinia pestis PY-10]
MDDRGFSFTAGFSFIIADCSLIAAFLPVDLSYLFIFLICLSFLPAYLFSHCPSVRHRLKPLRNECLILIDNHAISLMIIIEHILIKIFLFIKL